MNNEYKTEALNLAIAAYYHEAHQEPQERASAAQFVETLQYTEAAQRELERNYAILERSAI